MVTLKLLTHHTLARQLAVVVIGLTWHEVRRILTIHTVSLAKPIALILYSAIVLHVL